MRSRLTLFFSTGTLWSQVIFNPLASSLNTYLDLTATQVTAIADLNRQLASADRFLTQRQYQLQIEIAQETAREPIYVNALGLRYRELELIRREMEAQRSRTREQLQALLTSAQKAKLATLQEALLLRATACEAINQNLLVLPPISLAIPPGAGTSEYASFLLGPFSNPCPVSVSRFTFAGFADDTLRKTESRR